MSQTPAPMPCHPPHAPIGGNRDHREICHVIRDEVRSPPGSMPGIQVIHVLRDMEAAATAQARLTRPSPHCHGILGCRKLSRKSRKFLPKIYVRMRDFPRQGVEQRLRHTRLSHLSPPREPRCPHRPHPRVTLPLRLPLCAGLLPGRKSSAAPAGSPCTQLK